VDGTAAEEDRGSKKSRPFASSIGVTVLVTARTTQLRLRVEWGEYRPVSVRELEAERIRQIDAAAPEATLSQVSVPEASVPQTSVPESSVPQTSVPEASVPQGDVPQAGVPEVDFEAEGFLPDDVVWCRSPHVEARTLDLEPETCGPRTVLLERPGVLVQLSIRRLSALEGAGTGAHLQAGTRAVTLFLINARDDLKRGADRGFLFQPRLRVAAVGDPFVGRPNLRGRDLGDDDERIADLQYRNTLEFAVGHGIATHAELEASSDPESRGEAPSCRMVQTTWVPSALVPRVITRDLPDVEVGMERLSTLNPEALRAALEPLPTGYAAWLQKQQEKTLLTSPKRQEVAQTLYKEIAQARKRIAAGIALLEKDDVRYAFQLANRVMAEQALQRKPDQYGSDKRPAWRLFQLAFMLMNLGAMADPTSQDRQIVDLIFFPTGGGKTEAYLGLAAFTLVLRRLRHPGRSAGGVSVLMRYTLRLLTLDQLSRAATLICALELQRRQNPTVLGDWPFEIGLWVGQKATPNRLGHRKDSNENTARRWVYQHQKGRRGSPIPLKSCPWCQHPIGRNSFRLMPNEAEPIHLHVLCLNPRCAFQRAGPLPIVAVDDAVYHRLPCFLIATVDKFAAIPWTGQVGMLFGKAERYDDEGYYGPMDERSVGRIGQKLPEPMPPPDLIIQDELHLISGPLGTMVALYETALEALCTRTSPDGSVLKPKIVASTATVRRAHAQIKALFGRSQVQVFPPPGPDRKDSFFALTMEHGPDTPGRRYIGIAAQGRSLKVMLLRAYVTLLSTGLKHWKLADHVGTKNADGGNPADPYLSILGYFNALRELGGARRIVEDEVRTRLAGYSARRRWDEAEPFFVDREIQYEPVELTSRVSTDEVSIARAGLSKAYGQEGFVDVALATNMISVGLDIDRAGLMVILGQPLTSAEYIQASSRVGRPADKPGLVVTLYNVHKPRDRSHFERFEAYHESFYRAVEASSVTPFSPPALERGLPGVLVGLTRHGLRSMTRPAQAQAILQAGEGLKALADVVADRAEAHADLSSEQSAQLRQLVVSAVGTLYDAWKKVAQRLKNEGTGLQYQEHEEKGPRHLLYTAEQLRTVENPPSKQFKAERSMRGVEPTVRIWLHEDQDEEASP